MAYYRGRGRRCGADPGPQSDTQADTHAGPERLRAQLQSLLPDYMVPAAFVPLDAWPLTGNGKLDRKALPAPDGATMLAGRPYVAPRTPIEEVLAAMWAELLGVEQVGVHDNFFDLGGHSLMAMRLIAAIRETFGISLPLKMFFETPTVEHMGRACCRTRSTAAFARAWLAYPDRIQSAQGRTGQQQADGGWVVCGDAVGVVRRRRSNGSKA